MCVRVCESPLLASCWSHSCVLIGSRSGHDTAKSGRDNDIVSPMETLSISPLLLLNVCFWFSVCNSAKVLFINRLCLPLSVLHVLVVHIFLVDTYADVFFLFFSTGIDFKIKTVELQGKKIKLQIWWVNGLFWVFGLYTQVKVLCLEEYRAEKSTAFEGIVFQFSFLCCYIIVKHLLDIPPSSPEIC